ncbi:rrna methyltransferase mitochondrial [Fusarium heterosporum]|uniref:rRNA methyltransferase 1, mitochondrial n=1 Tax=Fusarium heterosporum TaxID=42747 RepID=A0A8H5SZ94_FUSHE|nr:rrna methyltransferase mitochondrial [Fusarium heterosporum]
MLYPTQLRVVALSRPLARLHPAQTSFAPIFVRSKALSAIVRGVVKSEQAQYGESRSRSGGFRDRKSSDIDTRSRRGASPLRRSAGGPRRNDPPARRDEFMDKFSTVRSTDPGSSKGGTRNWRQEQKLRKKLRKKDEEKKAQEEREADGTGRRTRRRRFADPENEFGNRSLVHRMKYGDLKEVADSLQVQQPVRPRTFQEARREFREPNNDPPRFERRVERTDRRSEQSGQQFDRLERRPERQFDRSDRSDRRSDRSGRPQQRFDRSDHHFDGSDRPHQRFDRSDRSAPRQDDSRSNRWNDQEDEDGDAFSARRGKKKEMMAMTVKYTTAASQFLYGRSVVKAALEQNRRQLYNLYIYGGENRRDSKDNTIMTRLAEKHKVPITIVPNDEQRIMDKMSMGRPHNGFVLEASPLPQLPIKSLGKLEESTGRLGFHVDLDFQNKEEAAVNGTDTFVRRSNDVKPKPFVLLLNEILDPGNLGGIIRTASYLGVDAVGITNRGSSTLTPVVLKSAAGAVEEISLFTVDDPAKFVEESGKAGWKTYAAVAPPDRKLVRKHGDKFVSLDSIETQSPLNEHPCLLVLGNEGYGLSKPVKVAADYELSVPRFVQGSCVDSLNVSVAAGLLCHSFVRESVAEIKAEPAEPRIEVIETEKEIATVEVEVETSEEVNEIVSDSEQVEKNPQVDGTTEQENKSEEKQPQEKEIKGSEEAMF